MPDGGDEAPGDEQADDERAGDEPADDRQDSKAAGWSDRRDPAPGTAAYVFRASFRLEPSVEGVWTEPERFETTVFRSADPPGEPGWRFFRDNLWRAELSDPAHFADLAADALGVPVDSIAFRELRTSPGYLDELKAAVADDLDAFADDSVDAVLSKYLGSSIHVV